MNPLFHSNYQIRMQRLGKALQQYQRRSKDKTQINLSQTMKLSDLQKYWTDKQVQSESLRMKYISNQIKQKRVHTQKNLKKSCFNKISANTNIYHQQKSQQNIVERSIKSNINNSQSPKKYMSGLNSTIYRIQRSSPSAISKTEQIDQQKRNYEKYYRQMLKQQRVESEISQIVGKYY